MQSTIEFNPGILDEAIKFAIEAHKNMTRKGTDTPYILHPLEAASIVATMTPDIEVIAAAVLHDTVEDNKNINFDLIEERFGTRIRNFVAAESEEKEEDAVGSWKRRKQATIEYFMNWASQEEKMIALGDKLSNIRSIHRDYITIGDELWKLFNQSDKYEHCWYYKWMAEALKSLRKYPAYQEYCQLVNEVFNN
jgi:myo-inositol-1(or 4)-monophosphatase